MHELEIARRANGVFIARLKEQVEALQQQNFPGRLSGPYIWLKIVSGLIDTAREYLNKSEHAPSPQEANRLITDAAKLGQHAVVRLADLHGAQATEIPYQVVRPLQRWFDELNIKKTSFFRAEHAPNYELARFRSGYFNVRDQTQSLKDALSDVTWPIHRVTVPSRSLGMLPYFAVVAHEAGHAIFDDISPFIQAQIKGAPALASLTTRIEHKLGRKLDRSDNVRLVEIRNNWIEEFAADAIAHHIVGPAFYFALFGFLEMSEPGYGIGDTHPPSYSRRRMLYKKLSEANGYCDIFHQKTGIPFIEELNSPGLEICNDANRLYAELKSQQYDELDSAIMANMVEYLEDIYDDIFIETHKHISANFPSLTYTPAAFESDIETHLEALCEFIPPIEEQRNGLVSPTALSTVLNVGWVASLTRLADIKLADATDEEKLERIHTLLIKAVELAEARHEWDEAK